MRSLTLYFSLIVGDKVLINDEVWNYYLILQKFLNTLLLRKLSLPVIDELDTLITEHHYLYTTLFDAHLKPKHHHALHYRKTLLKFGPLVHLWAMRFEGKNHQMKVYGQVIRSRINISKSLLIHDNYDFSYNVMKLRNQKLFDEIDSVGPALEISVLSFEACYKWIKILGNKYEIGTVVATAGTGFMPTFGKIKYIIYKDKIFSFVCLTMDHVSYCSHTSSYIGEFSVENYVCFTTCEVSKPLVFIVKQTQYHVSSMEF